MDKQSHALLSMRWNYLSSLNLFKGCIVEIWEWISNFTLFHPTINNESNNLWMLGMHVDTNKGKALIRL